MRNIVDDLVYFLERQKDGRFQIEGEHRLADLHNNVPGFGDRITLAIDGVGTSIMEVVGRYFVRHLDEASDSEWIAWFIIVQSVDLQEADDLLEAVSEHYAKFVRDRPPQKRERAPRVNATPTHDDRRGIERWRRQDAERQKHHPVHKLDKPQMRALRFLADHPECTTVDLIPNAGEKTMEVLSKVGCVRPGGKDNRGFREWHITDEGRAELQREAAYKNWSFD
jgi:hypothetical protein